MTGRRRYLDPVIARPVVRAMTGAVVLIALGNLIAIGCVVGWLRAAEPGPGVRSALLLFTAAAVTQLFGGFAALLAWTWSR